MAKSKPAVSKLSLSQLKEYKEELLSELLHHIGDMEDLFQDALAENSRNEDLLGAYAMLNTFEQYTRELLEDGELSSR